MRIAACSTRIADSRQHVFVNIQRGALFKELQFLHEFIQRALVQGRLRAREFGVFVLLDFIGQVANNRFIRFHAAQHKGGRNLLEVLRHRLVRILLDRRFELVAEFVCRRQESSVAEIHNRPEFHQAVFHRRTAHGNLHGRMECTNLAALFAIGILDVLGFVNYNDLPVQLLDFLEVQATGRIGGNQQVGIKLFKFAASSVVNECGKARRKLLDFHLPVPQKARRHHHESATFGKAALLLHLEQECNHLQSFTKAHVIGQNTAKAHFQVLVHPRIAAFLIGAECGHQVFGLGAIGFAAPGIKLLL